MSDLGFNPPADTAATPATAPAQASTVDDGHDLTQLQKWKAGLEPARVAEVVRTAVILLGLLGVAIPAGTADLAVQAIVGISAGVFAAIALVSWILTTFVRNRVTPVNKLSGH